MEATKMKPTELFYKYFLPIWIIVIVIGILSAIYGCSTNVEMMEEQDQCVVQNFRECKIAICPKEYD